MTISNIFLLAATIFAGLMAGLFYSYSCSVMPGLSKLSDEQFLLAMQSINRAIQNPGFFISFFGILISLPVATWLKYTQPVSPVFWLLVAATVIYFAGSLLVTATGNIPLNNALDKMDISHATKDALSNMRQVFEKKWINLNVVRATSSLVSFICLLLACLKTFETSR